MKSLASHFANIYSLKASSGNGHTLMEISSNFGFTDFFYKEMLNSLVSFSSRNTFSLDLLFKESIVYAKVCTIFSLWSFFGAGGRG